MSQKSDSSVNEGETVDFLYSERLRIMSYIRAIVNDAGVAEDIFQETCVKALEHCDKIANTKALLSWAMVVARNKAISYIRKSKTAPLTSLSDELISVLEDEWTRYDPLYSEDMLKNLDDCIGELNDNNRSLLYMRYVQGLKTSQIALELKRSTVSVYKAIVRLNAALKNCMKGKNG